MAALSFPALYSLYALCGALLGLAVHLTAGLLGCRARPKTRLFLTLLFFAALVPALHYWEVERAVPFMFSGGADTARFGVHVFVLTVAVLVSIVDFEYCVIPDVVMIPATVIAVLLMTCFPGAALPDYDVDPCTGAVFPRVLAAFYGLRENGSRFLISACAVLFWVFALLDRRWYPKLGWKRAAALFFRRLRQSPLTLWLPLIGLAAVAGIWFLCRAPADAAREAGSAALLSALTGMAASMLLVWGVRLIGGAVLGREAMGFGDVILIGFFGAVFGWQGGLILFFLAPLAGVLFGLARLFFRSGREIPFGPFLSLAALALIFFWNPILLEVHDFLIGPLVAALLLAMGVLMALLLWVVQIIKRCFR